MNSKHWGFFLGAFWELLRFALVLLAGLTLLMPAKQSLPFMFLVWTSSLQLMLVVAYVALGLYPEKYGEYLHLLRIGKLFSLIPGTMIFVILLLQGTQGGSVAAETAPVLENLGLGMSTPEPYQRLRLFLAVIIIFLDSIFLLFLLLFGREKKDKQPPVVKPPAPPEAQLPNLDDVTVEGE
ncbi:MAG: hypothetical protein E4H36_00190 [Spirochaetales bacterium]|nr:MAG: hypothetical protein E4H36_00190 [Spirochaetales bacterium]